MSRRNTLSQSGACVLAKNVDIPQTITGAAAQEWGFKSNVVLAPTVSFTNLAMGGYSQLTYSGTVAPTDGGHVVGFFGAVAVNAPGLTIPLAIGSEGIAYVTGGNVALLVGLVGTVGGIAAGSTVTQFIAVASRMNANLGTVAEYVGYQPFIPPGANGGTIGAYIGYDFPLPNMTGIGKGICFRNTSGFAITSNGSICDSSQQVIENPTSGTAVEVLPLKSFVLLLGGNLASLTLTLPLAPIDGQEICFLSNFNIAAFSLGTTGPITAYGQPTSMTAATPFRMRYIGSKQTWARSA